MTRDEQIAALVDKVFRMNVHRTPEQTLRYLLDQGDIHLASDEELAPYYHDATCKRLIHGQYEPCDCEPVYVRRTEEAE